MSKPYRGSLPLIRFGMRDELYRGMWGISRLSFVFAFFCCGCEPPRDNASEFLETAKNRLESNEIGQAKNLAEQALDASDSESQRREVQEIIDEATARQNFLNRRVEELTQKSEAAVASGDVAEARRFAERALQIDMATNLELARLAISRIEGFERGNSSPASATIPATTQPPATASLSSNDFTWADVAANVKLGVVVIASEFEDGVGTGTGFVIGDGLVVTNHHVISNQRMGSIASRVLVKDAEGEASLSPGCLYREATKDIAIIRIGHKWDESRSLTLFEGDVRQGDEVAALGHPKGYEFTFSMGHVSAVRDALSLAREFDGRWVQHSAPISRGNSGGPLLNRRGQVIAMNSWYHDEGSDQNLNFAIASTEIVEAVRISKNRSLLPFKDTSRSASELALRTAIMQFTAP